MWVVENDHSLQDVKLVFQWWGWGQHSKSPQDFPASTFPCSLSASFTSPAVWASQLWDGTDISPQGAARADHLHAYCTSVAEVPCIKKENTQRQRLVKPCRKSETSFDKEEKKYANKVVFKWWWKKNNLGKVYSWVSRIVTNIVNHYQFMNCQYQNID